MLWINRLYSVTEIIKTRILQKSLTKFIMPFCATRQLSATWFTRNYNVFRMAENLLVDNVQANEPSQGYIYAQVQEWTLARQLPFGALPLHLHISPIYIKSN